MVLHPALSGAGSASGAVVLPHGGGGAPHRLLRAEARGGGAAAPREVRRPEPGRRLLSATSRVLFMLLWMDKIHFAPL